MSNIAEASIINNILQTKNELDNRLDNFITETVVREKISSVEDIEHLLDSLNYVLEQRRSFLINDVKNYLKSKDTEVK